MAEQSVLSGLVNRSATGGPSATHQSVERVDRPAIGGRLLDQRSAVTNGQRLFVRRTGGDGRGPWARRMRDVIELHISDLGGIEAASEAEKSIIRRAATLTIELERLEAKFSTLPQGPRDNDLDMYQRCSNSLRRLLESIGIQRRPRDVTPSLEGFLAKLEKTDE
jgi:hypothetical protein